jgi:DNA-binding NtrC family response regulator
MTPRPTVVLVDGNPFQRGQNEAALRRAGYDTIALAAPSQALSLCDREGVRIDAFVATSSYRHERGLDLVRDMRTRRGALPALLLWDDPDPAPGDLHGVVVLVRPYAMERFTDEVTRLLETSLDPDSDRPEDERVIFCAGSMAMSGSPTDEPSRLPASQRL